MAFLDEFLANFFSAGGELKVSQQQKAYAVGLAAMASPKATRTASTPGAGPTSATTWPRSTVPTLVIHGDADAIVPIEVSGNALGGDHQGRAAGGDQGRPARPPGQPRQGVERGGDRLPGPGLATAHSAGAPAGPSSENAVPPSAAADLQGAAAALRPGAVRLLQAAAPPQVGDADAIVESTAIRSRRKLSRSGPPSPSYRDVRALEKSVGGRSPRARRTGRRPRPAPLRRSYGSHPSRRHLAHREQLHAVDGLPGQATIVRWPAGQQRCRPRACGPDWRHAARFSPPVMGGQPDHDHRSSRRARARAG